jgi:GNAT superfamily N-acetyltransferase
MDIKLKLIDCDDFNILSILFSENNVPVVTNNFLPFSLTQATAKWIACDPHQDRFYICILDGKAVGFSMLRGWEEGYSVPSFGMFVDHQFQGRGIGKVLMNLTIEEARKLGCFQVRLSVYANNLVACKIYHYAGFIEIERSKTEKGLDYKIIMIKDLI